MSVTKYVEGHEVAIVFGVSGALLFLIFTGVLVSWAKFNQEFVKLLMIGLKFVLSINNFSLDMAFLSRCFSGLAYYAVFATVRQYWLVFTLLPIVVNGVFVVNFVLQLIQDDQDRKIVTENFKFVSVIGLLGLLNTELLSLFYCRAYSFEIFRLRATALKHKLEYGGLLSIILGDLPQLVIQGYLQQLSGVGLNSLSGAAILTSSLRVIVAVFRRVLTFCVIKEEKKIVSRSTCTTPRARASDSCSPTSVNSPKGRGAAKSF